MRAASRCLTAWRRHRPITGGPALVPHRIATTGDSRLLGPLRKRSTCLITSSSMGKGLAALIAIPHILPSLHVNWRLIFSQISVDEQEVKKAFENFLSSTKDEAITLAEKYDIYIEQLSRAGNLLDAAYLLRHLCDRQIHLHLNTYNILLAAACEANNFDIFSEIFKSLLVSRLPPNTISYMNVAKAFQKVADEELLKFITELSEIIGHSPTVMNRLIFMTAKSGQLNKAVMIFEELKNMGCKMDIATFNTVLAILGRAGQVDRMLAEFNSMKYLGYTPDVVTYNTLINCLRWLGKLDLCNVFAAEMVDRGFNLDLRTFTALIDAFGRAGHVQVALRMFDEMKKSQQPSIYVYRSLISNLKKAGKYELALNLLEEMKSDNSKLLGPEDFKQKNMGRRRKRLVE